jgi:hypothetical protein
MKREFQGGMWKKNIISGKMGTGQVAYSTVHPGDQ